MLDLLEANDLAAPDDVEYGEACVWLFWREQKLMVAVDVDDVTPNDAAGPGSSE